MENKFIITGFGRSGTTFLSELLNDITNFTVKHEPRGSSDESNKADKSYYRNIYADISKPNYLEVNSYLRFWINEIKKTHEVIILARNPLDIYLSVCNRKPESRHKTFMDEIYNFCKSYYFSDFKVVKFDHLNNMDYIKKLCDYMDMEIVKEPAQYSKNPNKAIKYKTLDDLPMASKKDIIKLHELNGAYKAIIDF